MNLHSNARLTLRSRADLVEAVTKEGLTLTRAAARFRVSERTRPSGWAAFAGKAWLGCRIAPAVLIAIPRPPRERRWPWCWPCARCVCWVFRSPSIAICHGPPSRASSPASCVRQVLQKGLEVLVEVGVLVGSRTGCGA
jgi:hypothetical protein